MINHLRAIGSIQVFRFFLGLALGGFFIYRGVFIPPERRSRLEPGDETVFLSIGIACLVLAALRGIQGAGTLRAIVRRRWSRAERDRTRRSFMGIAIAAGVAWVLALAAIGAVWAVPYLQMRTEDLPAVIITALRARLPLLLVWTAGTVAVLGHLLLGLDGRRLRRFGIAMALIDLVNLAIFPFTTAAGTYGILIYRHQDVLDFFEGTYSAPATLPAGETRQAA